MLNEALRGLRQGKDVLRAIRHQSIRQDLGSLRELTLKTPQQKPAVEKPDAARRATDRARLPLRTPNIPLPASGEPQRRVRARALRDSTPAIETKEPFDFSKLTEQAAGTTDGRRRQGLPRVPRDRINELENTIEEQRSELSERCLQIADLHNVQQQQHTALLVARDAIENLEQSVADLQETAARRENEAAAVKRELLLSVQAKHALSEKLAHSENEITDLLQKLLHLSTDLNNREVALDSAQERIAALEQELAAKAAQEPAPAPAIEEDEKRQGDELDERRVQLESQLKRLESMLAAGDEQINKLREAKTKPPEHSDAPDTSSAQFESEIRKLESTLADRDRQIKELTETNTKLSERFDTADTSSARFEGQIRTLESTLADRDQQIKELKETNTNLSERFDTADTSSAQFESQIRRLESTIVGRDRQLNTLRETNSKLSERCDELTQTKVIFESAHKLAQEKLKFQADSIKSLESALRAEQESAEQKIDALTGVLHREREVSSAAERETASIRREIALLLPKLAMNARSIQ